jgi:hypothetical protein
MQVAAIESFTKSSLPILREVQPNYLINVKRTSLSIELKREKTHSQSYLQRILYRALASYIHPTFCQGFNSF